MVRTTRGEIDVGLAILLFCCTGGIGFIIYIIIYFSQPEDRCVFCAQKTVPYTDQEISSNTSNLYGQSQANSSSSSSSASDLQKNPSLNYCPNCGARIDGTAKFCDMCGTELEK